MNPLVMNKEELSFHNSASRLVNQAQHQEIHGDQHINM
jgi:hypothetical protein